MTDVLEDDFGNSKAFMKKKNHIVHIQSIANNKHRRQNECMHDTPNEKKTQCGTITILPENLE